MTDIDDELRRALAISPSPDFVVRTRRHIVASSPASATQLLVRVRSAWRVGSGRVRQGYWTAGLTAAAVLLAALWLFPSRTQRPAVATIGARSLVAIGHLVPVPSSPRVELLQAPGAIASVGLVPEVSTGTPSHVVSADATATVASAPSAPIVVLIHPAERRGFRLLLAALGDRRFELPSVVDEAPILADAIDVTTITGPAPLDVAPLPAQ